MRHDDIRTLGEVPLFVGVDPLTEVHTRGVRRVVSSGTNLFVENTPATTLFVLLSGRVRVTRCGPDGAVVVLHFADPGDVLGCAILGGARIYPGSAEVLEDAVLLAFDERAIEGLIDRFPVVSRNALRMLSGRMEDLRIRLRELTTARVDQRIAHALVRLCARQDVTELALSRQDLAELVGTTQYTVSRTLAAWEKAGWLSTGRQRVRVLDLAALRGMLSA
jgi:CRP-like cAMP-binding protein